MSKFIHLHTHSHYSLLNALPKIPELVQAAKDNGMGALALTDNGNLYGAIEFYKECQKAGIKPILGIDAYKAIRTRLDKQAGVDNRRSRLILLAKNNDGYKNLIKLVTESNLDGFYYKPRIDDELLLKYSGNLICISPAFSGEISQMLRAKNEDGAKSKVSFYQNLFGKENFFLEITHHPEITGHNELMEEIKSLAEKTEVEVVAAQEVYYIDPKDKKARDTLLRVQTSGDWSEKREFGGNDEDFSFTDEKKMGKNFRKNERALENTLKIQEMCDLKLDLGKWLFPAYEVASGLSPDDELKRIVYEGVKRRDLLPTKELTDRAEYELGIIFQKGYSPYFLVVGDLLKYAHEHKILTTIRGSVAGSLVTYLAGITNVNPLEYKLPFERFLNPERPSAPDIDMDYADNRRDEMIEYAKSKYGRDKVAQIGTFGTMMARGSVRDVTRALGHPYSLGDQLAKMIPMGSQGFPMTIDRALEIVPELKKQYKEDPTSHEIIDIAKKIEGCARHISVHAAGVVISPIPLTDIVPLQYDTKGENKIITQYDMYSIDENNAGLLKFDFLGIKNLSILAEAVEHANKKYTIEIDIEKIPVDDKKTFELLAKGETAGLFQLNGTGMTSYLKQLRPSSILDINAMVALYRPGPMESIPTYIERKHNTNLITYLDPRMKDILSQSYGVITYQDDVLLIAIHLAGYSWLEADKLRKAMGKKIPAEMEAQKEKLLAGLEKKGMSKTKALDLWKLIEPFAAYGFNKCLAGNTILTDAKTGNRLTIEDLYKTSSRIYLHTMSPDFKVSKSRITNVCQNGIKSVFRIKMKSGKEIKATDNHPFFTINGWKNLQEIKTSEKIAVPRGLLIENYEPGKDCNSPYKAAILGYLLSEGNLCHPYGVYYYSTDNLEIDDYISYAKKFENSKIKINRGKPAASVYVGQLNPKRGNMLMQWLKDLGLTGKKAAEKFIPNFVFELSKENQAIFIGKLWQGDGTVSIKNQQLFYATSSKKLAADLQHLLLRFDILSTIHTKKFKYRGIVKIGYTVCITHRDNITKFTQTINPHLIGNKKIKIDELGAFCAKNIIKYGLYPAFGTKDTVPKEILTVIKKIMSERKLTIKTIANGTGLCERLFMEDSRKKGFQREVIGIIAKNLQSDELMSYAKSHIYWDEVVSIEYDGQEMTYDITVPPYHNFIANDIVVHNSHAASYGRVAYQTAYMKANFPAVYLASVLTADSGDVEKIGEIIAECKRMQIPVMPPDVNESFSGFTVVDEDVYIDGENKKRETIRFGLTTVKNFGEGIALAIINEREEHGKFKSLGDFLDRIKDRNLNKKSLEALIKCGALDAFGERGEMLANMENLLFYNKENKNSGNQDSLFGGSGGHGADDLKLNPAPAATQSEKLAWEKELLGLYISGHPLDKFKAKLAEHNNSIKKIKEELKEGMVTVIAGIVEEIRPLLTKKGEQMIFMRIADYTGSIETVVFPRTFTEYKAILLPESCLAIKGKLSLRNEIPSIIIDKIKKL